jgi:hypothetical protein
MDIYEITKRQAKAIKGMPSLVELDALQGLCLAMKEIGIHWEDEAWVEFIEDLEFEKQVPDRYLWIHASSHAVLTKIKDLTDVHITPKMLSHAIRQLGQYREFVKYLQHTMPDKTLDTKIFIEAVGKKTA